MERVQVEFDRPSISLNLTYRRQDASKARRRQHLSITRRLCGGVRHLLRGSVRLQRRRPVRLGRFFASHTDGPSAVRLRSGPMRSETNKENTRYGRLIAIGARVILVAAGLRRMLGGVQAVAQLTKRIPQGKLSCKFLTIGEIFLCRKTFQNL